MQVWEVCLALAVHVMTGALYYSPVMMSRPFFRLQFGDADYKPVPDVGAFVATLLGAALYVPVFLFFLDVAHATTIPDALLWAAIFAIFDAGINAPHVWYEKRPVGIYHIHTAYHALSLSLIALSYALTH
mmetsp:Transcript_15621/g.42077  ORF Transcript_15621/g.42077 Transcript_15621/m.42077 type:complete len:130 (-) Transcript_15621:75-464(-)